MDTKCPWCGEDLGEEAGTPAYDDALGYHAEECAVYQAEQGPRESTIEAYDVRGDR